MLAVRALIFVAVLFDVLIAISIPPVPGIQFYIVGIDFKNTTNLRYTDAPLSSSFRGQVNSAAESKSVQNLVQLQVSLCVFAKIWPTSWLIFFFTRSVGPLVCTLALACNIEPLTKHTQGNMLHGQSQRYSMPSFRYVSHRTLFSPKQLWADILILWSSGVHGYLDKSIWNYWHCKVCGDLRTACSGLGWGTRIGRALHRGFTQIPCHCGRGHSITCDINRLRDWSFG